MRAPDDIQFKKPPETVVPLDRFETNFQKNIKKKYILSRNFASDFDLNTLIQEGLQRFHDKTPYINVIGLSA